MLMEVPWLHVHLVPVDGFDWVNSCTFLGERVKRGNCRLDRVSLSVDKVG